jgi:Signal transduction histidine kinase
MASVDASAAAEAGLPRPPGVLRRFLQAHPRGVDVTITLAYILGTIAFTALSGITYDGQWKQGYVLPLDFQVPRIFLLLLLLTVTSVASAFRRKQPLAGLMAILVVLVFCPPDMMVNASTLFASWVMLYSVPVYQSVRLGWVAYVIMAAASTVSTNIVMITSTKPVQDTTTTVILITVPLMLLLVPLMLGISTGDRHRYTEAIIDRAHQLARERDQRARLAVAEERTRIAREMHDIVAHSLSVMITLSEGAARVAKNDPETASGTMRTSADTGREALAQMRRLIGALQDSSGVDSDDDGNAPMVPTPGVNAIPDLIEGFRAAGMDIEMSFQGSLPDTGGDPDQVRELAIYRTIQEALTNSLRYAGIGSQVTVTITESLVETMVRITDTGPLPGSSKPLSGVGSGNGLVGLKERLRTVGGTVEYGASGPGWMVMAMIPREGEPVG